MYDNLRWRIPLIVALTLMAALIVVWGAKNPQQGLKLGFDLKGGVELCYRIEGALTPERIDQLKAEGKTPAQIEEYRRNMSVRVKETIEVISRRLDPTGVKAPDIRSESSGEIILRLPGLTVEEVQSIKRRAEQMGLLNFRVVVSDDEYAKMTAEQKKTVRRMKERPRRGEAESTREYYIQEFDSYKLTGEELARVFPDLHEGLPAVGFTFKTAGSRVFAEMTKKLAGKGSIAIILNGELYSAPRVNEAITRGAGVISGSFTPEEVDDLVAVLQAGSLQAPLILQSESFVGPDLGVDSRDRGYRACWLAFLLVVAFMTVYYLFAGAVADFALALNLLFLIAAMMLTGAVLTLPGIAGIVLTVGMAVDANVLIYERVREELNAGQTLRTAVKNGYERAFVTIFDSNLTTLLTALILYGFGTGAVRGFAVTLSIGIVVSMFSSLFITRAVFDLMLSRGWLKERLTMMRLLSKTHIRFVRWTPVCIAVSLVCIIAGMSVFFWRGGDNYGIDFSSGTSLQLRLKGYDARPGEAASAGAGKSAVPVAFVERRDGADAPAELTDAVIRQGLVRLKKLAGSASGDSAAIDFDAVTFDRPEGAAKNVVRFLVPEPEGAAAGKAFAALVAARGREAFRLRMDIEEVRRRIGADFPNADVQTAFKDQAILSRHDSDQFTIRVPGRTDNETQADRESVPTRIEQAFAGAIDRKPVGIEFNIEAPPPADNTPKGLLRVTLKFVQTNPADNALIPVGMRQPHIEGALASLGMSDAKVHWPTDPRKYYEEVSFDLVRADKEAISKQLLAPGAFTFPDAFIGYYFVNPGQAHNIALSAIYASLLSFLAICIYVWIRFHGFKYGIAAVVALIHDVLFTLGALAVCAWMSEKPSGAWIGDVRLSLDVVAGILMLIGYSINDTIVVFDRIRETLRRRVREMRGKRQTGDVLTPELIDTAINQTLSRTTLTSFTTWIVCVTLFVAGGPRLHGLALCLIIGVVVGTYSSVAIASPILVLTHAWEARRARKAGRLTAEERDVAEEDARASRRA